MFTFLVIMNFNFYNKIKPLLSYLHYGFDDKDANVIKNTVIKKNDQAVFGVFS